MVLRHAEHRLGVTQLNPTIPASDTYTILVRTAHAGLPEFRISDTLQEPPGLRERASPRPAPSSRQRDQSTSTGVSRRKAAPPTLHRPRSAATTPRTPPASPARAPRPWSGRHPQQIRITHQPIQPPVDRRIGSGQHHRPTPPASPHSACKTASDSRNASNLACRSSSETDEDAAVRPSPPESPTTSSTGPPTSTPPYDHASRSAPLCSAEPVSRDTSKSASSRSSHAPRSTLPTGDASRSAPADSDTPLSTIASCSSCCPLASKSANRPSSLRFFFFSASLPRAFFNYSGKSANSSIFSCNGVNPSSTSVLRDNASNSLISLAHFFLFEAW